MKRIIRLRESKLRQIIAESVRRVLNEKWYPEDDDDISDYSFGMIAKLSTRSSMQLDEDTIAMFIECAISAPDMPIHEIEQEVEEILWYWIEEKTGEHLVSGFDWDSEDIVFDNRSKNK